MSLSVSRRSGSEGKSVYWILTIKQGRAKGPCRTECHFRNIYIFLLAYLYLLPYSVQIILVWNLLIILHYDMIVLTRCMLIVSYHLICCNLIFIIVAPSCKSFQYQTRRPNLSVVTLPTHSNLIQQNPFLTVKTQQIRQEKCLELF